MSSSGEPTAPANQALLSAALGGLLCLAASACDSSSTPTEGRGSSPGSTETAVNADTPRPNTACDGGVSPTPAITSSTVAAITLDDFAVECQTANGILEIQPHCGGSNACRGMSYDTATETLIRHTCRAVNSCAGFSCVVCD